ncbi:MAG: sialate O-acetylesterase [Opitutaceae bacterium]|jgi:sialate O-acetylesterase|nr:sialate O-acetylesterase [Opitutaceae bacterium]
MNAQRHLILLLALATASHGAITLPQIFSPGVVLQRDTPIAIWGTAEPGEKITVRLTPSATAAAAADPVTGYWRLALPAQPATNATHPRTLIITGTTSATPIRIPDVLVGEVWFASGQSNMEWIVKETDDAPAEIARSANPGIRIIRIQRAIADAPAANIEGKWAAASPAITGWMTAVGYYFAKKLSADLGGIPVGIINASRGSARIQPWIPAPAFDKTPAFAPDRAAWQRALAAHPAAKTAHDQKLAAWQAAADSARAARKTPPRRPEPPYGPGHYNQPSGLYNGMVAPLTPYAIRGILWYQGEANARQAAQYREALPALITSWREAWGNPRLPFLVVQLAPYRDIPRGFLPDGLERAALREAQALATRQLPRTGLVVTLDLGGPDSAEHPRNKRPVGERLARLAQPLAYARPPPDNQPAAGPTLANVTYDGPVARVTWQPGTATGLRTTGTAAPAAFEIAGADRRFHPATARIENRTTIVLSSPDVPAPVAVRYAFCNDPRVNLVNSANLPAAPFRTDDWPLPARNP